VGLRVPNERKMFRKTFTCAQGETNRKPPETLEKKRERGKLVDWVGKSSNHLNWSKKAWGKRTCNHLIKTGGETVGL